MHSDRDALMRDNLAMKQQCADIIQALDQRNHEHCKLVHENGLLKVTKDNWHRDAEMLSRVQRNMQLKLSRMQSDLQKSTVDRDAAMQEYHQVS